jgi:hypothetical protein
MGHLKDLDVDGRIILNWVQRNHLEARGVGYDSG